METNIVNPMHAKQRSKKQELISIHCTDILSDEEQEKGKKVNVKNERGVKKTKMLKSVNSWITLPIVESK